MWVGLSILLWLGDEKCQENNVSLYFTVCLFLYLLSYAGSIPA